MGKRVYERVSQKLTLQNYPRFQGYLPQIYIGDFFQGCFCVDFLEDEVEIIEEDKKIEKIARRDAIKMIHFGELYKPTENEEILRIKINELIDEINKLKEK